LSSSPCLGRGSAWRRSFGEGLDALAAHFANQADFVRAIDLDAGAYVTPRERE